MKITIQTLLGLSMLFLGQSCKDPLKNTSNSQAAKLTQETQWESLMNPDLWRGYNQEKLPSNWNITDSLISCYGLAGDVGGDIISKKQYANFEFFWEWKISPEGNSGAFYHVVEDSMYHSPYQTAPEYQLLDDVGFPSPIADWQKTGANYAMHIANEQKNLKPVGQWNTSRIVFDHGKVSHFLNGALIVSFDKFTTEWETLRNSGKWSDYPDYGKANTGHLALQDHGSGVWFKSVKIKDLGD
ncbi:MAG: DUF1080 domain-containing protein [Flavobacteriia bacterium]|nr:DUF1080 domain-containing protein [Flavobacteriia bacterium]